MSFSNVPLAYYSSVAAPIPANQLSQLPSARFGFNPLSANCRSAHSRYGQVTHQGYGLVGPSQQRANMAAYFAAVRAGQVCMCGSSVRSCPIPGWAH